MIRFLILAVAWWMWSGPYSLNHPLVAAFGAASCLGVALLGQRMRAAVPQGRDRTLTLRVVFYVPWLLKEIVLSGLAVTRIVLRPKLQLSPCIVRVPASQRGEGARVLFANSITLTPGTVSLATHDNSITVYALDEGMARDLLGGEMDRRVSALEAREPRRP